MYTTKQDTKKGNRLSMDADLFKSTIKNFENLSGTKSKVPIKNSLPNQTKEEATRHSTQEKQQKTQFNKGSNKKISPKPKAIARSHYKRSTPSPQQEGMCTSSESESDSDEEVNVDDVEEVEVDEKEQEDVFEDLTKLTSETSIPSRRHL